MSTNRAVTVFTKIKDDFLVFVQKNIISDDVDNYYVAMHPINSSATVKSLDLVYEAFSKIPYMAVCVSIKLNFFGGVLENYPEAEEIQISVDSHENIVFDHIPHTVKTLSASMHFPGVPQKIRNLPVTIKNLNICYYGMMGRIGWFDRSNLKKEVLEACFDSIEDTEHLEKFTICGIQII